MATRSIGAGVLTWPRTEDGTEDDKLLLLWRTKISHCLLPVMKSNQNILAYRNTSQTNPLP